MVGSMRDKRIGVCRRSITESQCLYLYWVWTFL